jgi:hypothetical protein
MLGDEHRMPAIGRLLAVIDGPRRGEPPGDEVVSMGEDGVEPPVAEIGLPRASRAKRLLKAELRNRAKTSSKSLIAAIIRVSVTDDPPVAMRG